MIHSNVGAAALDEDKNQALNARFDGCRALEKKFNWRLVAPT